jgi:ketosteroid isomerase-like protein
MHPNAQLIEKLYTAIMNHDAAAIAACYADDAIFEDIAFRRHGRKQIHEMWRLVCHARPAVTSGPVSADDQKGTGRWTADYMFGKTATDPGRRVVNSLTSEFTFRGGLIATHRDTCDPVAWAKQAYPFPKWLVAAYVPPLRRFAAARKLEKFLETQP